jgi:hypothetical protein
MIDTDHVLLDAPEIRDTWDCPEETIPWSQIETTASQTHGLVYSSAHLLEVYSVPFWRLVNSVMCWFRHCSLSWLPRAQEQLSAGPWLSFWGTVSPIGSKLPLLLSETTWATTLLPDPEIEDLVPITAGEATLQGVAI